MSWFDASGIASLAKNALKEAQKTIDKALDITDDIDPDAAMILSQTNENIANNESVKSKLATMKQSISNPVLSSDAITTGASNLWGSFSGSFFDAKAVSDDPTKSAVTVAPTSSSDVRGIAKMKSDTNPSSATASDRLSSASVSGSVEILSSPISSISDLNSPSSSSNLLEIFTFFFFL